jgi:hypothetical protein
MSFADLIASDVDDVLLNTAEFGESVTYHRLVDGAEASGFPKTITVVCEDVELARDDYADQLVADRLELVVCVPTREAVPQVDTDYITRGGIDWTVVETLGESYGLARVRARALDLVRRGGREVQR